MGRIVEFTCSRCGHPQRLVVESAENDEAVAEIVRASGGRVIDVDEAATAAALRLQRLKSLPTSLPVGGIITPV